MLNVLTRRKPLSRDQILFQEAKEAVHNTSPEAITYCHLLWLHTFNFTTPEKSNINARDDYQASLTPPFVPGTDHSQTNKVYFSRDQARELYLLLKEKYKQRKTPQTSPTDVWGGIFP